MFAHLFYRQSGQATDRACVQMAMCHILSQSIWKWEFGSCMCFCHIFISSHIWNGAGSSSSSCWFFSALLSKTHKWFQWMTQTSTEIKVVWDLNEKKVFLALHRDFYLYFHWTHTTSMANDIQSWKVDWYAFDWCKHGLIKDFSHWFGSCPQLKFLKRLLRIYLCMQNRLRISHFIK